jgi:hypothetical protein
MAWWPFRILSPFLVQWEVGGCIIWLIFAASFGLLWLRSFFMTDWLGWCVFSWWFSMHCMRLRATRLSYFQKNPPYSIYRLPVHATLFFCFSSIDHCLSVCLCVHDNVSSFFLHAKFVWQHTRESYHSWWESGGWFWSCVAEELAMASVALPAVGFLCGPENRRKKSNYPNSWMSDMKWTSEFTWAVSFRSTTDLS